VEYLKSIKRKQKQAGKAPITGCLTSCMIDRDLAPKQKWKQKTKEKEEQGPRSPRVSETKFVQLFAVIRSF
jgi:hypothetical protein